MSSSLNFSTDIINELKFDQNGLIPAIIQDNNTNSVLMLGYMNRESIKLSIERGKTVFYSRSKQRLWEKGETSGHTQIIKSISTDCDKDTLLIKVEQIEAACHTGEYSCFYNVFSDEGLQKIVTAVNGDISVLESVYEIILDRVKNPKEGSYTNYLFDKGIDKMLKKVGEEASEVIIAAKNRSKEEVTYEIADLMYHLSVVLVEQGLSWPSIFEELNKRK